MRSNDEINKVRSRPVPGRKGPGRPKKTWEECVKQDLKVCGLSEEGTQDRLSWRSSVKNSRQEPTPSNGSLPQSMAALPARRVLGMRTRSFNKTGFDWLIDWLIENFLKPVGPVVVACPLAQQEIHSPLTSRETHDSANFTYCIYALHMIHCLSCQQHENCIRVVSRFQILKGKSPSISQKRGICLLKRGIQYICYITFCQMWGYLPPTFSKSGRAIS